jgi:uncharacterized protein (TIGR00369 family)
MTLAVDASIAVPDGYAPLPMGGEFIGANGPLYLRHVGDDVRLGFRVELRHTNPMRICHGGMMASFCDMLLPVSVHRKSPEVGMRFLPTISLQIDYLAPAPLGAWIEGEAQVLRATRSLVFVQGLVSADGTPVARASGVFKIGPPFGDAAAAPSASSTASNA